VLTAVLSCLNSGLYTASRMTYSLGQRGDAPHAMSRTTARGVPQAAILGSVVFGFLAVYFNYQWPDTVFQFLLNSSGAVALFVWLVICCTQLRMRGIVTRESPERLVVRMWLFPYPTWATIAMILFVLGYLLTDHEGRVQVLLSTLVAAAVVAVAVSRERFGGGRAGAVGGAVSGAAADTVTGRAGATAGAGTDNAGTAGADDAGAAAGVSPDSPGSPGSPDSP
jgi:GABA permease